MATSGVSELAYLIPELWSDLMYEELRSKLLIANFFSRDFTGPEILSYGDTVHVNQISAASGQETTDDKDLIVPEQLTVSQVDISVNRIARASFEITNLAKLQSKSFLEEAQAALVYAVAKKIEDRVIASLVPSAAAPDHIIAPAAPGDLAAADLAGIRTLLSIQKVPTTERAFFADPQYYGDLLQETNFISSDFIPAGSPAALGAFQSPLYGFEIYEHDGLTSDLGYACHRSALAVVMQQNMTLKLVDMAPAYKSAFMIMAEVVFGVKLMDNKRIVKISG